MDLGHVAQVLKGKELVRHLGEVLKGDAPVPVAVNARDGLPEGRPVLDLGVQVLEEAV